MSGQSSKDGILLFIMRHGEAEPLCQDDKGRQLTEVGRGQVARAAYWLQRQFLPEKQIDLVLVSPYRRTRQTFDTISAVISARHMEICQDITPNGHADWVHDYLDARLQQPEKDGMPLTSLMVVSHMPLVSYLVDSLCQSHTTSLFSTASIAVVNYWPEQHKGQLLYHYQGD
ncbi:phosphohistidine phosphatase SixA [Alteromonas aestuariivivens]|nr:phosphohistidine phosphatase SixA [Alteromonas aestuariivivens]